MDFIAERAPALIAFFFNWSVSHTYPNRPTMRVRAHSGTKPFAFTLQKFSARKIEFGPQGQERAVSLLCKCIKPFLGDRFNWEAERLRETGAKGLLSRRVTLSILFTEISRQREKSF
jgi:hypothetical protein